MRILLVEDDLSVRSLVDHQLRRLGYETTTAEDGLEAWEIFERHPFELVVSDIMMPRVDGLDLCRRIRSIAVPQHYTYVMLLTTLRDKQWYLQGLDAGADDFVTKPVSFDELVVRLRVAEHTLHLERCVRHLAASLGACPACDRVVTPEGDWMSMKSYVATHPVTRERRPCPSCRTCAEQAEIPDALDQCLL